MKRLIRKIARLLAVAYANRQYRKAVRIADGKYREMKQLYYVVISPVDSRRLIVTDRKTFRRIMADAGMKDSILSVRDGSFYHTADRGGKNALTSAETEARRRAFVNHIIYRAGLA